LSGLSQSLRSQFRICRRDDDIENRLLFGPGAALAAESSRMNPAYEDGKGRMYSAAVSSLWFIHPGVATGRAPPALDLQ
jgi:hypothetical protein